MGEHTEVFKGTTGDGAAVTVTEFESAHEIQLSVELTAEMVATPGLRSVSIVLSNQEWMKLAQEVERTARAFAEASSG
jgi:hypothetical protein